MQNNKGHRERIRERLLSSKMGVIQDYELMEILLCMAQPRKDTKPLAKDLIKKYGSFAKAICAEEESLLAIPGMGDHTLSCFRLIQEGAARLVKEEIKTKTIISSWQSLLNYCRTLIGHSKKEMFLVLYLDSQNALLGEDLHDYGTIDQISIYPREITKRALFFNASAIILAHNHPSGNTKPSKADIDVTKNISSALSTFSIKIHDHVIVSDRSFLSFKSEGLL